MAQPDGVKDEALESVAAPGSCGVTSRTDVAGTHECGLVRTAFVRSFFRTFVRAVPLSHTVTSFSRTG